jgi:hypothetical protein
MVKENKTKLSKKELKEESKKTISKKEELKRKRKCHSDSDDDDDEFDTESDSEELDVHEYRKLLAELYPSKFINKKVEAGEKVKKAIESSRRRKVEESEEEDDDYDDEDDDYDDDYDEEEDDDYDEEEEEEEKPIKKTCRCGKEEFLNSNCSSIAPNCGQLCGFPMKCGHICQKVCHVKG